MEHSLYNLALGLIHIGHEVVVYTGKMYVRNREEVIDGIQVIYSPYLKSKFSEKYIDESIFAHYVAYKESVELELLTLIEKERPDYILAVDHLWGVIPFIDIWGQVTCPVGLVYHMSHNPMLVERAASQPFAHFFSVSRYLSAQLKKISNSLTNRELLILPNSVQFKVFAGNRTRRKTKQKVIFCNARLSPEKGIQYLVQALPKVLAKGYKIKLLLCGGNFHFGNNLGVIEQINTIIAQHPSLKGNVEILPRLSWKEIPGHLAMADMVVLPTANETFGIAALESMAAGVPLIATKVGNLPDLVRNAGILIQYGDSDAIAEGIIKAIVDRDITSNMTARGVAFAREYDFAAVAEHFVNMIGGKI